MRLKLILLSIVIFPAFALATTISKEEAARKATEFIANRRQANTTTELNCTYAHSRQHKAQSKNADGNDAAYYVFSGANDKGFVIVAGDDRLPSIIGYSDTGRFDTANMPEACSAWLDAIAVWGEECSMLIEEKSEKAIAYPTKPVEPLLTTKWDQENPYNTLTPVIGGKQSLTGCVATATAQIMNYYHYPERSTGSVSYNDNGVQRTMNFDDQPAFDWSNMLSTYTSASPEANRMAVARLMQCVGYGVQMTYGSDVSVAHHRNAGEALYKYFGYDSNIHRYERNKMSDAEWINIITDELYAGRPVLYDGKGASGNVGHTFVCDGYDGNGMFHFNWGWSGNCDGYFNLSALTPKKQGAGGTASSYTFNQAIECHIQPAGAGVSTPQTSHLLWIYDLFIYVGSTTYKASIHEEIKASKDADTGFFFYCMANGHKDFNGEVCSAIITDEGIQPIESTIQSVQITAGGYKGIYINVPAQEIGNGTFHIGTFYRTQTDGEWQQISANLYEPRESNVTIDDTNITYKRMLPYTHLTESGIGGIGSKIYTENDYTITLNALNDGSTSFAGCIGIQITPNPTLQTQHQTLNTTNVFIAAGETCEMEYALSTRGMAAGEYTITSVYTTASTSTQDNIMAMGEPRTITLIANPGIGVMQPATGYYIIERPKPGIDITLQKTLAGEWQGSVVAKVTLNGEDTGVTLSADNLSINGMTADYGCTVKGNMSTLASSTVYDITFYLDHADGMVIGTGKLILTGTEDSINDVESANGKASVTLSGGMLRVSSGEHITSIGITDMQGRVLRNAAVNGYAIDIPVSNLPKGIYIIGVNTVTGKTVVKVRI